MRRKIKQICVLLSVLIIASILAPSAFARQFAPVIDTENFIVNTQYAYATNDESWLRKLVVKEDLLSVDGLSSSEELIPLPEYPYNIDAKGFKAQIAEYIELYTLEEDSQKAAYIYLLQQVGALSIISEPDTTDATKADWLRSQGIVITEEDEQDADKVLMISALYAMMKNDLYYVYTGQHFTIPQGTPLEEAVVMYLMALSGDRAELMSFIIKYFGTSSIGSLDDYIYYTSLMTLFTTGYISPTEITTISREEVFRRLAIMTIRKSGVAIDAETATQEEIQQKYLCSMLGTQYSVSLDTDTLMKSITEGFGAYYVLQRMAYQDAGVTISREKYSYEDCFRMTAERTDRFDLEKEFYSDIYEYDVFLDNYRTSISINPTPLSASGVTVFINGTEVKTNEYAIVELANVARQTISIVTRYKGKNQTKASTYKLNVNMGTVPTTESNLTGFIEDIYTTTNPTLPNITLTNPDGSVVLPSLGPAMDKFNDSAMNVIGNVLTLNDKGQLVDQNGNVVSDSTFETLAPGYKYVLGDDGIITVIPIEQTTEATSLPTVEENKEDIVRKTVIIGSAAALIVLIGALIFVMKYTKSKGKGKKSKKKKKR